MLYNEDNIDNVYDTYTERILLSEDYQNCIYRDKRGNCYFEGTRCWHVWTCPIGYERKKETKQ